MIGLASRSLTTVAIVTIALLAQACVKDDPIVTGTRDAAPPPPPATFVVPAADPSDVDAPNCSTCAETLDTSSARGTLCRKNKPRSSAIVLNELVSCVCNDKCVQECATYCNGATLEAACQPCIFTGCTELLNECMADVSGK